MIKRLSTRWRWTYKGILWTTKLVAISNLQGPFMTTGSTTGALVTHLAGSSCIMGPPITRQASSQLTVSTSKQLQICLSSNLSIIVTFWCCCCWKTIVSHGSIRPLLFIQCPIITSFRLIDYIGVCFAFSSVLSAHQSWSSVLNLTDINTLIWTLGFRKLAV